MGKLIHFSPSIFKRSSIKLIFRKSHGASGDIIMTWGDRIEKIFRQVLLLVEKKFLERLLKSSIHSTLNWHNSTQNFNTSNCGKISIWKDIKSHTTRSRPDSIIDNNMKNTKISAILPFPLFHVKQKMNIKMKMEKSN